MRLWWYIVNIVNLLLVSLYFIRGLYRTFDLDSFMFGLLIFLCLFCVGGLLDSLFGRVGGDE